ncbi:gamma-butyrobetaine dioxygenase [Callorhinchus milii]|uniref:gamma-butyrobetaine dioxygenase n=1 Tax=Callorhinchus milii TaxID=7868 RepID=V9KPR9_CALMI|nr:gamma-butyrobetaine dioxygenase [Callorhinchus milii]|eukprot:gi/632941419/ref/XP_007885855.1/ PREDICTED: gamma-butyrobetaine dioxygenase [Callorhinchus milii]
MWRSVIKTVSLFYGRGNQNALRSLQTAQKALSHPFQGYRQHTSTAFKVNTMIQPIIQVEALDKDRCITVRWEDGSESLYPYVWLRDNCQCSQCFLHSAKARKFPIADLDVNVVAEKVTLTNSAKISVTWPDKHISEFNADWLKHRCFGKSTREKLQEDFFLTEKQYWGSDLQIPTTTFDAVLSDDEAAYQWLRNLRRVGIAVLKDTPKEKGQVNKLVKRIGYHRMTFYGYTWQVEDKINANNLAYTSGNLSLHTDYPSLHNPPGIQFLHCIKQAEVGGESEIADGFHLANQLRQQYPEAFRILTSTLVDFTDSGVDYCDFSVQSKNKTIMLDHKGNVVRIHYSSAIRDSVFDLPVEQVHPFYSALKKFWDLIYKPENLVTFKMEPGDVMTFDNWRLLHGRRSYTTTKDSTRHLEGAYVDWDEVMSRLRCLKRIIKATK